MRTILTIAGSDPSAGAGIQSDIKTCSYFRIDAKTAITAVTSQNTKRVTAIHYLPPEVVASQITAICEESSLDAVKIGMLGNADIAQAVAHAITQYNLKNVIVDPIITSSSGTPLLDDRGLDLLLSKILPLSFLVTPNIPEAEKICSRAITTLDQMKEAALFFHSFGVKNVLIKGGHLPDNPTDLLFTGTEFISFEGTRQENDLHGTGCIFSSAIAAELANGNSLTQAIQSAKKYVSCRIKEGGINLTQKTDNKEKKTVLVDLEESVNRLKTCHPGKLIPEIQSNMAFALPGAKQTAEVAAIPGRIIKLNDEVYTLKTPAFGASQHISKIVLTAMKHDPSKRAAMNIAKTNTLIDICKKLNLRISSFDRKDEPEQVKEKEGSSLEWGVNKVIEENGFVPDIIYDTGDIGKEAVIRILASHPKKIVAIIQDILHHINIL